MQQTLEVSNLSFVQDIGEIMIDSVLEDGVLKDVPILGTLVGVGKCVKNLYDASFAKRLIAFLIPLSNITPEQRTEAIYKWQNDENYRGKVGDTILGMINRCDDAVKAQWLSKLFIELVVRRNWSRLFMRAEKTLSSLSVMDVQAFLNIPDNHYYSITEQECEPFIGSGLYQSPKINAPINGDLDLEDKSCETTEAGYWIYNILNDRVVNEEQPQEPLF